MMGERRRRWPIIKPTLIQRHSPDRPQSLGYICFLWEAACRSLLQTRSLADNTREAYYNIPNTGVYPAVQRQTAVTAYFSSKQLLLFAFARILIS